LEPVLDFVELEPPDLIQIEEALLRECPSFYTAGGPVMCGPVSINSAMSRERYLIA
jgi:hypothetical protein